MPDLEPATRASGVPEAEELIEQGIRYIHQSRGDFPAAIPLFERILGLTADDRIRGIALQNLGAIAAIRSEFAGADRYFLDSYHCFQRAGYTRGEAIALNNYAAAAVDRGKYRLGRDIAQDAVAAAKRAEDLDLLALANLNLAKALAGTEQLDSAADIASAALGHFTSVSNGWRRVECLRLLGEIHIRREDRPTALRCLRQGLELAQQIGARVEISQIRDRLGQLESGP
ncbi:MAG: tetratricopeptide repeat protein [Gemmatimonadetes bacterium]|nr:tetratricopeptide repeat protein [Gemmatimonadota bacterium]